MRKHDIWIFILVLLVLASLLQGCGRHPQAKAVELQSLPLDKGTDDVRERLERLEQSIGRIEQLALEYKTSKLRTMEAVRSNRQCFDRCEEAYPWKSIKDNEGLMRKADECRDTCRERFPWPEDMPAEC